MPLLKLPLSMLQCCGANPLKQTTYCKIRALLSLVSYMCLFLELLLQFVVNWKGWETLDEFAVWSSVYQMISKGIIMLVKRNKIATILFCIGTFWQWQKLDKNFQAKIENIHEIVWKFEVSFIAGGFVTITAYLLKPLFSNTRILPFDTYHPVNRNSFPVYQVMYGFQVFVAAVGCCSIVSFDVLFLSLIAHLICEMKILKQRFLNINVDAIEDRDDCFNELTQLVQHHNIILRCVKDLDSVYSSVLLNQFACSIFGICIGLLSFIVNGFPPDLQHFLKYSTYLGSIFCQLFIYCSGGAYLTVESRSISDAVYSSKWWAKSQLKLRKSYVMVIQRANRADKLTAGGMFTLNLENFTNIVKTSLSFFTLVQAMFTRTDK